MLLFGLSFRQGRIGDVRDRILAPLKEDVDPDLAGTEINYRHMIKSARMVSISLRRFATFLGCSERELLDLAPLLLHLEGLVYRADYHFEDLQQGSERTDREFVAGMRRILALYGLDTPEIRCHIDTLIAYFESETDIVCGNTVPDEATLREVTRVRSSDWRLALGVIEAMLERPCSPRTRQVLESWFALYEIRQDVLQYAEDVDNSSYNTLRLYVRRYGPTAGVERLRKEQLRLARELLSAWRGAGFTESLRLWRALSAPVPPVLLAALPWPLVRRHAQDCVRRDLFPPFPSVVDEAADPVEAAAKPLEASNDRP